MDDGTKADDSEPAPNATEALASTPPHAAQVEPPLDADSPADVRVTFIVLMLAASALCALPRQWGSAGILLGLALVGLVVHLRARAREAAEAPH